MNKREIIERLKNIAEHAVHTVGEEPFVMSLDDGIAVHEAIELLEKPETDCSEIPNNSDTISRQMAIDAFTCKGSIFTYGANECKTIVSRIMTLPSIQSECPKGRWIPTASEKGRHECSRCHEYAPCYQDGSEHLSTFCVLCGAKMEEDK